MNGCVHKLWHHFVQYHPCMSLHNEAMNVKRCHCESHDLSSWFTMINHEWEIHFWPAVYLGVNHQLLAILELWVVYWSNIVGLQARPTTIPITMVTHQPLLSLIIVTVVLHPLWSSIRHHYWPIQPWWSRKYKFLIDGHGPCKQHQATSKSTDRSTIVATEHHYLWLDD